MSDPFDVLDRLSDDEFDAVQERASALMDQWGKPYDEDDFADLVVALAAGIEP